MKLVVLAIDSLSFEILYNNKIESLNDGFNFNSMKTTIPHKSSTAWTSIWSGVNPSQHGVLGNNSAINESYSGMRIWDILNNKGLTCMVRDIPMSFPRMTNKIDIGSCVNFDDEDEVKWRGEDIRILNDVVKENPIKTTDEEIGVNILESIHTKVELYKNYITLEDQVDVLFLGINELELAVNNYGIDGTIMLGIKDEINDLIECYKRFPMIIISDHGFETALFVFNVNRYLQEMNIMNVEDGKIIFDKSTAYPTNIEMNNISITEYGIHINTTDKAHGFITDNESMNIKTELASKLRMAPFLEVISKDQLYSVHDRYFENIPDLLLYSPQMKTFIRTVYDDRIYFEPFIKPVNSIEAIFSKNFDFKFSEHSVNNCLQVSKFICEFLGVDK